MTGKHNGQVKILIATGIYPPDLGGPATLLTELPGALKKAGMDIKVITYSDTALSEQEKREGMVWRISRQSPCSKISYFWRMWRLSGRCDIIYATDTYSVGYFAYLIKKLTGKKYIIRFAGDSAWETASACGWIKDYIVDFQNKKYGRRIEKMKKRRAKILAGADRVIAVSNFIAGIAKAIGAAEKNIRVIYNAVDFFGELPQKTRPMAPTLVFAGRLMPWKGVGVMLDVVAELKKEIPDIIFEVLGDGPEMESLKEQARKLSIEQNVKFRGRVSEPESHKIFSRSTIFVLNTNYEGLPHSVLNAMAVGLPVIATSIGGNAEVVQSGENGLLVPYNDQKAWITAVKTLLNDEALREKFIQNGKKTLEKFKWKKLVAETVEVIKSI
ncbi:MAG: glycosyltransferase family 4 protein [Candidatus Portnoybacteria bacterium]|nr:glycosyltransferase family 4 protein [Candidatus Portnoybacteria bacterium]MDD4982505.1 glycosyltransferase family 4 protein [Candidatus Portnoybacteria bacterium]